MRAEYAQYSAAGWALCDIPPGRKGPTTAQWNERDAPFRGLTGAGLLHAYSGTCAVDIDHYATARDWLAQHGVSLDDLMADPAAVMIRSPNAGHAKLLYALPEPRPSYAAAHYEIDGKRRQAMEFRCATRDGKSVQDVLPPTLHPLGLPYRWAYGDELLGDWRALPPLPAALEALWPKSAAEPTAAPASPADLTSDKTSASEEECRAFLAAHDPDMGLVPWLKVGAALHWELNGAPLALELWDEWSRKGKKYKSRHDLETHYRTFRLDAKQPATFDGWRGSRAAALEDFELLAEASPEATAPLRLDQILERDLVFVKSQSAYYAQNQLEGTRYLSDYAIRHLYSPFAPATESGGRVDPVHVLQFSKSKPVADAVGLHPGEGLTYVEDGTRFVNAYVPQHPEPLRPNVYDMEVIRFLWSRITNPLVAQWLEKFYAHAVQKPGVKIRAAPLLHTKQTGTGKNTLMHEIPIAMFGARYCRTMSQSVLRSQFNDVAGETWWLYLEELHAGSLKRDRVDIANRIKSWITDSLIEVHPKGLKAYNIRNRLQLTASSNFDDATHVDNTDRRWCIGRVKDEPLSDREVLEVYTWLKGPRGGPALLGHFSHVDTCGFNPNGRAPDTTERQHMIALSLGDWEARIAECIVRGQPPFHRDLFTLEDVQATLFGTSQLSARRIAQIIAAPPFRAVRLSRGGSTARLWAWRNGYFWEKAPLGVRRAHLETGTTYTECTAAIDPDILSAAGEADPA